jgi:cyanate permease
MIGETPEWAFWAILALLALMILLPTIKRQRPARCRLAEVARGGA